MTAQVSTPVFEGPFDVLLRLVSEHKVDVCDIPIAPLVDAFITEMKAVLEATVSETAGTAGSAPPPSRLDLETTTEFLVIAAILLEMKAKSLLPGPDEIEDDEELLSGFEERDRLIARLLELQAYAAAADDLARMMEMAQRSIPRVAGLEERFRALAPDLLAGLTPDRLALGYVRALAHDPREMLDLSHVTVEAVTVSEAVAELEARLPNEGEMGFRELCSACTTKMQVIVRFLALLELCKRGRVSLDQGETFGDLVVSWIGDDRDHRGEHNDGDVDGAGGILSMVGGAESVEEYEG